MGDKPEYKAKWKPKQSDNPAYNGEYVHPEIDNPGYTPLISSVTTELVVAP